MFITHELSFGCRISCTKDTHGNQNKLTELLVDVSRRPLIELSAIITDRLEYIKWRQRLNLVGKMEQQIGSLRGRKALD